MDQIAFLFIFSTFDFIIEKIPGGTFPQTKMRKGETIM
jgi:hypothetical protein